MTNLTIPISEKWEKYLKQLADYHQVDLNKVINELFTWAFSDAEGKKQFEAWLDDAFPQKGEAEDKERTLNEETSENEEDQQDESEEEAHENQDYSEDRPPKP
jgi:hypothetical protein